MDLLLVWREVPGYHPSQGWQKENLRHLRQGYKPNPHEALSRGALVGSVHIRLQREFVKLATEKAFDLAGGSGQKGLEISLAGEVLTIERKPIGDIVAGDLGWLQGKFLTSDGRVLRRNGECLGRLVNERYSPYPEATVISTHKAHRGSSVAEFPPVREAEASTAGKEAKAGKAQLLEGFAHAGVSQAEAEELVALYMQQQSASCPPSLPPRPPQVGTSASDASSPLPSVSPGCAILVVDKFNHYESIVAQFHLEFLRARTANNGGPWLFHRVDSAGLDIHTPWRSSSFGKLEDDAGLFFINFDEVPIERILKAVTDGRPCFKTDDRPFESDQIVDRIRSHHVQGLDDHSFLDFDYILAFNRRIFEALRTLSQRVHDEDKSITLGRLRRRAPPRVVLLQDVPPETETKDKVRANIVYSTVCNFALAELACQEPKKGIADGGLRTSFMQIQLKVQKERVTGERGEVLRRIEDRSQCKLYVAKQSDTYGWVVAIVGQKGRLWEAEALIRELRSGEEIEWKDN